MHRHLFRTSIAAICLLGAAGVSQAQSTKAGHESLAERLEELRRKFAGGDAQQPPATSHGSSHRARGAAADVGPRGYRNTSGRTAPRSRSEPTDTNTEDEPPMARVPRRIRPIRDDVMEPIAEEDSPDVIVETDPSPAPAATSSRRMEPLVEQSDAPPAHSSRRQTTSAPESAQHIPPRTAHRDTAGPPFGPMPTPAASRPAATKPLEPAAAKESEVLFGQRSPLLRVETLGPRKLVVDKESAYTVRIQNLGEVVAEKVVVRVQLPPWAEVASANPSHGTARPPEVTQQGTILLWLHDKLAGRSSEEMVLKIIPRKSQRFDLAVSWTSTPTASLAPIEVLEPKLQVAISGQREMFYGETKIFRLTVSNPGTGDAENVSLKVMSSDGSASQPLGTIRAGQSKILDIELPARQTGNLRIQTLVTGDNGLRAEATEQILVRRAGLKLDVAAPKMKYAGTIAEFVVRVTNPGNAPAEKLTVEATLPAGAKLLDASSGGSAESDRIKWVLDSLPAGEHQTLHVKATLSSPGENQLRVIAAAHGDLTDTTLAKTFVEALADLKLEVSDPSGPVAVGEEMTYEVRIRNRGTTAAADVEAVAFFSEGVEAVRVQGGTGRIVPGQVVLQPLASLAAGSEVVLKITAKASQEGNHVFRAEVRCKTLGTQLAAEETTLFYRTSGGGSPPLRAASGESPITDEPRLFTQ